MWLHVVKALSWTALQPSIKVSPLVCVDALCEDASHKGYRMILIVSLSIAQDRIPRQLHSEFRLKRSGEKASYRFLNM